MWFVIIGIVVVIIVKVFMENQHDVAIVAKQGGMKKKYNVLISYLLSSDPHAKIFDESGSSLSIGLSGISGTTVFSLTQIDNILMVDWNIKNQMFGNHHLQWRFNQFDDQKKMFQKMEHDLEIYQTNMVNKYL